MKIKIYGAGKNEVKKVTNRGAFFTSSKCNDFYALEELGDGMNLLVRLGAKSE